MTKPETESVKAAIDRVIVEIDALKRRAYDAENVAWTLIVSLEKSDLSATSMSAIRDYAINEARPFLLRSPNPALTVPVRIVPEVE